MYFRYCLILLFIGFQGFAQGPTKDQIQFSFDNLIEVNPIIMDTTAYFCDCKERVEYSRKNKLKPYYLLTNSKDNSYYARLYKLDSLNHQLSFYIFDEIFSVVEVKASDFQKAEFIKIDCTSIFSYENRYKFRKKQYDYTILKDTIINKKVYGHYVFKSNNPKREKRQELWRYHYIVDKSESSLPFITHITAYEDYKENKRLPKGRLIQKIYENNQGIKANKYLYSKPTPIDKKIVMDKDCRYLSGLKSK